MLRNHFPLPIANLLHKNKEHLALRNNFRVTKKFLITKFDCSYVFLNESHILIYVLTKIDDPKLKINNKNTSRNLKRILEEVDFSTYVVSKVSTTKSLSVRWIIY